MGSGSSRNQVTVETAAPEVSDVVITRARVPPPVRQSTIDKTVTETGAEVGKLRPVLKVPEDSFDDDEVAQEDDLEDVHDLEETFNSLGITGSSDMEVQRQFQEFPVKDVEHENVRTKWNQFTGGEDLAAEGNGGWAVRSTSGPHRLDIPLSKIVNNNNSNTNYNNKSKSAPTKFSWNTTEVSSTPEEWIYQKVRVIIIAFHHLYSGDFGALKRETYSKFYVTATRRLLIHRGHCTEFSAYLRL
ncbi:hypothetical protein C0J52_13772 [Blattella germanica]|nr:hypothetical protein C0J52_13772 [Blattella germanica]